MMKEKRRFNPTSLFPSVCGFLLLLLLLTFVSCALPPPTDASVDSPTSESTDTEKAVGTERPTEPSGSTDGEDNANALLAYYVSLIESLQEEIRILKAENFILSTKSPETDAPVSEDASDLFTYEKKNGEITILSYIGRETAVTVPREIEGCPVVRIGESAFQGSGVSSVVLPDTVTTIGWFAFSSCSSLASLSASPSLSSIGYGAFDGCPASLTLFAPAGSYLSEYGKSFGIAVRESE